MQQLLATKLGRMGGENGCCASGQPQQPGRPGKSVLYGLSGPVKIHGNSRHTRPNPPSVRHPSIRAKSWRASFITSHRCRTAAQGCRPTRARISAVPATEIATLESEIVRQGSRWRGEMLDPDRTSSDRHRQMLRRHGKRFDPVGARFDPDGQRADRGRQHAGRKRQQPVRKRQMSRRDGQMIGWNVLTSGRNGQRLQRMEHEPRRRIAVSPEES